MMTAMRARRRDAEQRGGGVGTSLEENPDTVVRLDARLGERRRRWRLRGSEAPRSSRIARPLDDRDAFTRFVGRLPQHQREVGIQRDVGTRDCSATAGFFLCGV